MDPVGAIALFCNVLDLGEKAIKVVQKAKEAYDSSTGQTKEHETVSNLTDHLSSISQGLESSQGKLMGLSSASICPESQIQSIAATCSSITSKVASLLHRCRSPRHKSIVNSARVTVRSLWSKKELDELQEELGRYQQLLQTALAVSTRSAIDQVHVDNETILKQLQETRKELDGLRTLADTAGHIKRALGLCLRSREEAVSVAILDALGAKAGSAESNPRYRSIDYASGDTFEWIFSDPDRILHWHPELRINLVDWLRKGSGVFHVAGKLGSGKSTLMKFIREHDRTLKLLKEWSGKSEVLVLSYFFWKPDQAQNTLRGLKSHLLGEAIRQAPQLSPILFPRLYTKPSLMHYTDSVTLTDSQVSQALDSLLKCTTSLGDRRIFILLDALDELQTEVGSEDFNDLVSTVQGWASGPEQGVKICVSSRELPDFMDFPKGQRIRLQQLTRRDMEKVITERIQSHPRISQMDKVCRSDSCRWHRAHLLSDCLIQHILDSAQGVFLWVKLVLRDLRRCMSNGTSMSLLRSQVNSLPTEVEDLVMHLFKTIPPQYQYASYIILSMLVRSDWMPPFVVTVSGASFLHRRADSGNADACIPVVGIEELQAFGAEDDPLSIEQISGRCNGLLDENHEPVFPGRPPYVNITHRSILGVVSKSLQAELEDKRIVGATVHHWACLMTRLDIHDYYKRTPKYNLSGGFSYLFTNMDVARNLCIILEEPSVTLTDAVVEHLDRIDIEEDAGFEAAQDPVISTEDPRKLPLLFLDLALERMLFEYARPKLLAQRNPLRLSRTRQPLQLMAPGGMYWSRVKHGYHRLKKMLGDVAAIEPPTTLWAHVTVVLLIALFRHLPDRRRYSNSEKIWWDTLEEWLQTGAYVHILAKMEPEGKPSKLWIYTKQHACSQLLEVLDLNRTYRNNDLKKRHNITFKDIVEEYHPHNMERLLELTDQNLVRIAAEENLAMFEEMTTPEAFEVDDFVSTFRLKPEFHEKLQVQMHEIWYQLSYHRLALTVLATSTLTVAFYLQRRRVMS
ncbi:hypothetical protein F4780DRAFT_448153 [Xylariomycetidae sp. FL0641]|nr:hypothetical protein F4780DRAFT_448153 [Xylariomycetidae sp. FL0641]